MKSIDLGRYALGGFATVAMLAACGGSQPPIGVPATMPQIAPLFSRYPVTSEPSATGGQSVQTSWMRKGSQKDDLLYLTQAAVKVFTYPQGKLVGGLQQHHSTRGECVDSSGNVFVTSLGRTIEKYAHGRTGQIGQLTTMDVEPLACAVDPTTGDLAVTGGLNKIDIFKGARGKPIIYNFGELSYNSFCSFDSKGNLFIVGARGKRPVLAELPKGGRKLVDIQLDAPITQDSNIQWDGKYLAVGISRLFGAKKTVIYRFTIINDRGTLVGTTVLGSPAYDMLQFLIVDKTVIVSNAYYVSSEPKSDVLFYNYPAGGAPTGSLAKAYATFGMALSHVQK